MSLHEELGLLVDAQVRSGEYKDAALLHYMDDVALALDMRTLRVLLRNVPRRDEGAIEPAAQ